MESPARESTSLTKIAAFVYVAMTAGALLVAWGLDINVWRVELAEATWQTHLGAAEYGLIATLPLIVLLILFECFPPRWLSRLKDSVDRHVMPLIENLSLGEFLLLALFAGVGEELVFRGLVQTWLEEWLPDAMPGGPVVVSIIIAGVCFGACHWINDQYAWMAAIVGMYLGAEFVLVDHLLAPIVTHACYDFFALWYLTARRKRPTTVPAQPSQPLPPDDC